MGCPSVGDRFTLAKSTDVYTPANQPHNRLGLRLFHRSYLWRYRQLAPEIYAQMASWRPVIAAEALQRDVKAENAYLLAIVQEYVVKCNQ